MGTLVDTDIDVPVKVSACYVHLCIVISVLTATFQVNHTL